jgi:hypothetical protein
MMSFAPALAEARKERGTSVERRRIIRAAQ